MSYITEEFFSQEFFFLSVGDTAELNTFPNWTMKNLVNKIRFGFKIELNRISMQAELYQSNIFKKKTPPDLQIDIINLF